jgi:hypothetical protein
MSTPTYLQMSINDLITKIRLEKEYLSEHDDPEVSAQLEEDQRELAERLGQ